MKPEECEHGVPAKHTCYKCDEASKSRSNDVLCERSLKKPMLTYEAWRVSFQSSEQAARAAYKEALRQDEEKERLRGALIRARQALMDSEGPFYEGMKILNEHT